MDWQDIFHWLYIAGMAIGAIHFILLSRNPRGVPRYEYLVAAFIPIWSGLAYLSMVLPGAVLEQGKIEVAGQITYFARYIDWVVTTPLLLLALSWTAMHHLHKRLDAKCFPDAYPGNRCCVWFGCRFLCNTLGQILVVPQRRCRLLVILGGIWGPLRAKTRSQGARTLRVF